MIGCFVPLDGTTVLIPGFTMAHAVSFIRMLLATYLTELPTASILFASASFGMTFLACVFCIS